MTLEGLGWMVFVNGLVQLTGLVVLGIILLRGYRELLRGSRELTQMTRAVAGLVYQESEKTRARIDDFFRQSR